jgi:hypothetical protein
MQTDRQGSERDIYIERVCVEMGYVCVCICGGACVARRKGKGRVWEGGEAEREITDTDACGARRRVVSW